MKVLYTQQPTVVVKEFNRWLDKQGYKKFIGLYYVVLDEIDYLDNDMEKVDNFITVYRQHAFPMHKKGIEVLQSEQQEKIKKMQTESSREVNQFVLRSQIKKYWKDVNENKMPLYQNAVEKGIPREIKHQKKMKLCIQLPNESNMQFRQRLIDWINHRQTKFDYFTELGVDCETYTDNSAGQLGMGNQIPFLVSFCGSIQKQLENGNIFTDNYVLDVTEDYQTLIEKIKLQCFWGHDCWEQFVKWIKINGYYQTGYIGYRNMEIGGEQIVGKKKRLKNNSQNKIRVKNFIVAHNGGRFDYGYLLSYLAQYIGIIDVIGTQSQIKGIHCGNIFFYDSALIHRNSLHELCQMMLDQKDWKKQIGDIVIDKQQFNQLSDQRIKDYMYYCFFDAHSVRLVHQKQFRDIYTKPFGQGFFYNSFNKGPFIHSAASLALTIFKNQFLEEDIQVFPKVLKMERMSMRGGHTQVYKPIMGLGICADIKSSYPTSMYNDMPWYPLKPDMMIVRDKINYEDYKDYDLLAVSAYKYPDNTLYPGVVFKATQNEEFEQMYDIVAPLSYSSDTEILFLWGVEVNLMKRQGAVVKIIGHLPYKPAPIFRSYIQKMFGIRQVWGETGEIMKYFSGQLQKDQLSEIAQEQVDQCFQQFFKSAEDFESFIQQPDQSVLKKINLYRKTQDRTCKLLMNSLFGKTVQQSFDRYSCGLPEDIYERAFEKLNYGGSNLVGNITLQQIPDYNTPLMEMMYQEKGQEVSHVGGLVRLASYITAISRCNLMEKLEIIRQELGDHRIHYTDTDCICISLKTDGQYQKFGDKQKELLDRANQYEQDNTEMDKIGQELQELIFQHPEFQKLKKIQVRDFRRLDQNIRQDFVETEQEILGTFQVEKFILECRFLGSKAYCGYMHYNGFQQIIKVKGVKILDLRKATLQQKNHPLFIEKREVCQRFCDAHQKYLEGDFEKCGFLVNSMSNFERIGTMTSVVVKQKLCCHSLIKRKFILDDYYGYISYPFYDIDEFYKNKIEFQFQKQKIRNFIKYHHKEEVKKYMEDEGNIAVQNAHVCNKQLMQLNVRRDVFANIQSQKYEDIPGQIYSLISDQDNQFIDMIKQRYNGLYIQIKGKHLQLQQINQITAVYDFYIEQVTCVKIIIEYLKFIKKKLPMNLLDFDYAHDKFIKLNLDEKQKNPKDYKQIKIKQQFQMIKKFINQIPAGKQFTLFRAIQTVVYGQVDKFKNLLQYQIQKDNNRMDKIEKDYKLDNIISELDYKNMRLNYNTLLKPSAQIKELIQSTLTQDQIKQIFGEDMDMRNKNILKCIQSRILNSTEQKVQIKLQKYYQCRESINQLSKKIDTDIDGNQEESFFKKQFLLIKDRFKNYTEEDIQQEEFDESILDALKDLNRTLDKQEVFQKQIKKRVSKKRQADAFIFDLEQQINDEVNQTDMDEQ